MMRDAVVRNIEVIGEAVKRLPQDMKDREPQIEWKSIAGLHRCRLADAMARARRDGGLGGGGLCRERCALTSARAAT